MVLYSELNISGLKQITSGPSPAMISVAIFNMPSSADATEHTLLSILTSFRFSVKDRTAFLAVRL